MTRVATHVTLPSPGAMVDHDSAKSGARRIAQIEGGDVQARGEVPTGPTGLLQDVYLQGRHRGEGSGAQEAHEDHGCGLAVDRHRHETQHAALLHQDRATDAWSAFEARSIRDMLARVAPAADRARVVSRERHPDSDADALAATATEQERLSEEQLAEAERHERRHHVLTVAVTLVQVAIAIATIAIIARGQRWPWHAAVGLGLVGVATGAYAYL